MRLNIIVIKMKREANIIRHPHYPEIIKFKVGSLKTISTLSNSNYDDELNNCERLSLPSDVQCTNYQDNLSCAGDLPHENMKPFAIGSGIGDSNKKKPNNNGCFAGGSGHHHLTNANHHDMYFDHELMDHTYDDEVLSQKSGVE